MEKISDCYGCLTLSKYKCDYHNYNINGKCPCTTCIIKMMCCEDCDKFSDWVNSDSLKERNKYESKISNGNTANDLGSLWL